MKCSPIWFAYVKDETPFKPQTYLRVEAGTCVILVSLSSQPSFANDG